MFLRRTAVQLHTSPKHVRRTARAFGLAQPWFRMNCGEICSCSFVVEKGVPREAMGERGASQVASLTDCGYVEEQDWTTLSSESDESVLQAKKKFGFLTLERTSRVRRGMQFRKE